MATLRATPDTPRDEASLSGDDRPVYLDCAATTPIEPAVLDEVMHFMALEYGNAGSRTHSYGQVAKERVQLARQQVARVVDAQPDEVIFTSGATESNNLAILGLAAEGERTGRKHIISTQIEHKAVLEPVQQLARHGFEVTLIAPTKDGRIDAEDVRSALRPSTLLVSAMAANNETGVIQPIEQIAAALGNHEAFFHVDAAQAFGKIFDPLKSKRIDLMSISGHKLYAPKGIGALISRRRGFRKAPLEAIMHGGGQERGLRPGTLPVALVAGLGKAAEIAVLAAGHRASKNSVHRANANRMISNLNAIINGSYETDSVNVINFSLPGVDSEAAILALKDLAAVSNGSACTSQRYERSHVLLAAGLAPDTVESALRLSWSHLTPTAPWHEMEARLRALCNSPRAAGPHIDAHRNDERALT